MSKIPRQGEKLEISKRKVTATYKGIAMRLTANLETMEASAQWGKKISRILYLAKLFFGMKVK